MRMNALWNCKNPHQGDFKKVLCVCSAGLLRSPTIAWVMSNHGYNTRAAGVYDYALVEIDEVLLQWADIVVCAEQEHATTLLSKYKINNSYVLDLPDSFQYRDPKLIALIETALKTHNLI